MGHFEYLRDLNFDSILLRIILALMVGGILGLERGRKNRAAGFRTYILVCLGATLVMMTNQFVYQQFNASDPTRLGAQVISGIGFLGAGTILLTGRNQVKGITTAAGLWTAACCGLAIGIGFYEGALLGAVVILLVMTVLTKVDDFFNQRSKQIDLYVEFENHTALREFIGYLRNNNYDVQDLHLTGEKKKETPSPISATLSVFSANRILHAEVISELHEVKGVYFIEEI